MSEEDCVHNKRIAENTKITYCTRVGRYRPNQTRPISVTFQNKEDKDQLMQNKSKLPPGLYVNHEYPPHIKRARDRLCPANCFLLVFFSSYAGCCLHCLLVLLFLHVGSLHLFWGMFVRGCARRDLC